MSRYIKFDDAIDAIEDDKFYTQKNLESLPTIEVSEEDLYIPLNNQTVERINRLHKDECGEYFDEEWLFSELEQIAEFREVSEDWISRAFALEVINDCINYPTNGDKACAIKNAQRVVPSEDCISREYILSFLDGEIWGDDDYIAGMNDEQREIREVVRNAPSVVPKAKKG